MSLRPVRPLAAGVDLLAELKTDPGPPGLETLLDEDRRALSALFWSHVHLHGRFELDMNTHLGLSQ